MDSRERPEVICKPYVWTIGDHKQFFNNTLAGNDSVNDTPYV